MKKKTEVQCVWVVFFSGTSTRQPFETTEVEIGVKGIDTFGLQWHYKLTNPDNDATTPGKVYYVLSNAGTKLSKLFTFPFFFRVKGWTLVVVLICLYFLQKRNVVGKSIK